MKVVIIISFLKDNKSRHTHLERNSLGSAAVVSHNHYCVEIVDVELYFIVNITCFDGVVLHTIYPDHIFTYRPILAVML